MLGVQFNTRAVPNSNPLCPIPYASIREGDFPGRIPKQRPNIYLCGLNFESDEELVAAQSLEISFEGLERIEASVAPSPCAAGEARLEAAMAFGSAKLGSRINLENVY
jgi:hypothetical protein